MTKIIIDIFMYLFEFMLFWNYSNTLFEPKKNTKIRLFLMLLNTLVLCTIYQFNITYLNVILMFITYSLLLFSLYNVSFKTAIFHSLIFMVVMLASEIFIMVICSILFNDFNALENNISVYLFSAITSKLIYFAIIMAILKAFAQKESAEQANKFFWLLFVMPLTSIMVLLCFSLFQVYNLSNETYTFF